jgi:hypothetical protein
MGKQVTVLFDYDSSVRGSMSDAFVIFDDRPIANRWSGGGHHAEAGRQGAPPHQRAQGVTDLGLAAGRQRSHSRRSAQHFGKELFGT